MVSGTDHSDNPALTITGEAVEMSKNPIVWTAYLLSALPALPERARKHLRDCVSYAVVFRVFAPDLPPLRLKHVFGIVPLPSTGATAHVAIHPVVEIGSYPEELTQDQIAYLHEQAEQRRRLWAQHKAAAAAGDTSK